MYKIDCSFKVFTSSAEEKFETALISDLTFINDIIRTEKSYLLDLFEEELIESNEKYNPDFSYEFCLLNPYELINIEIVIGYNDEDETVEKKSLMYFLYLK